VRVIKNWNFVITGPDSGKALAPEVKRITQKFTQELKQAGLTIGSAQLTVEGRTNDVLAEQFAGSHQG
jgi:hypothetical protein